MNNGNFGVLLLRQHTRKRSHLWQNNSRRGHQSVTTANVIKSPNSHYPIIFFFRLLLCYVFLGFNTHTDDTFMYKTKRKTNIIPLYYYCSMWDLASSNSTELIQLEIIDGSSISRYYIADQWMRNESGDDDGEGTKKRLTTVICFSQQQHLFPPYKIYVRIESNQFKNANIEHLSSTGFSQIFEPNLIYLFHNEEEEAIVLLHIALVVWMNSSNRHIFLLISKFRKFKYIWFIWMVFLFKF